MLGKSVVGKILGKGPVHKKFFMKGPIKDMHSKNKSNYTFEDAMDDYNEFGYIVCPKCGSSLEIDAYKCGNCGWKNIYQQ